MNFLRLPDPLFTVLFEDSDILAIDKPYGFNAHTNDSKIGQSDFIQDGLIEILEKMLQIKLHIVHRLDQTTSGVMIFGKSQESAKTYAEFFFERLVKKTYWFVTPTQKPNARNSQAREEFVVDEQIIHKGRELEAETAFKLISKGARFDLWQANPHTGRNHQIRIHAKAAGIPLLGDAKYDGDPYPFLCLHNRRIEFPNGVIITSQPPAYFENLQLLEDSKLARVIFETDRRKRLFQAASRPEQCLRLVHNKNDNEDLGYTLDQFGPALVLSWYSENWSDSDRERFAKFARLYDRQIYVRLMHNRGKDPINKSQFLIDPKATDISASGGATWTALEHKTVFEIRTDSGQSFGLFLDQRLQRQWVQLNSRNKSVLNLFSYTCGFSVAAALGGAAQVTSVDTNKNVLNWGKRNFELNDLSLEPHRFFCRDSLTFLDQCVNKQQKFDVIVCDPPSFSRGEKGVFKIEMALESLISKCMSCLAPNGILLFSTNSENLVVDEIRRCVLKVQKDLKLKNVETSNVQSAMDFELPDQPAILKSFLIRTSVGSTEQ